MTDMHLTTQTQLMFAVQAKRNWRKWAYPALLAVIYFLWISYMFATQKWDLLAEHWTISLTMGFGSLVAGATAEGGAAVAFPVFTKVLNIAPENARTFGLMIQSAGMTTAAFFIYLHRIRILGRVILWVTIGGIIGQIIGTYAFIMPDPYPRILFTLVAGMFGLTVLMQLFSNRKEPRISMPAWTHSMTALFIITGIIGGIFAAHTGAGVDMLTFIVLTLTFRMNVKISTPTTVVIMALNSLFGFYLHGVVSQDIGIVWDYWLVAVPIVVIGAPLGAYLASKVSHYSIMGFLLALIALEVVTTVWLVPISTGQLIAMLFVMAGTCFAFAGLLYLNHRIYRGQ